MEISTEPGPDKTLSALTCSALLSLVTALGDTGKLLTAVTAMLMAPGALSSQDIVVNKIFVFNTYTSLCIYQAKLTPRYNWNIVESGIKHHKPK